MHKHVKWPLAFGLGVLAFALYMQHRAQGLQIGDSSEYVLSAASHSLVHPPGYPIYSMLISFIGGMSNPETLYAAVSGFSAFCAALSVVLLFLVSQHLSQNILVALALTMTWMLHPSTLRTALDAEVFAMHHLFSLMLMSCGLYVVHKGNTLKQFFLLGLLCGLGTSHHHMIVLWTPFVLGVLWQMGAFGSSKSIGTFFLGTASGLLPYASLWWRSQDNPEFAFLALESWSELIAYALRWPYGTFDLAAQTPTESSTYLGVWFWNLGPSALILIACLVLGLNHFRQKSSEKKVFLTALYLTLTLHLVFVFLIQLPQSPHYLSLAQRFFAAPLLVLIVLTATIAKEFSSKTIKFICLGQCLFVALSAPGTLREHSLRHTDHGALFLKEAFAELPTKTIWLTQSDTTIFGALYGQHVLGLGPKDLILIAAPRLQSPRYRAQIQKRIPFLANLEHRQFNSTQRLSQHAFASGYRVFSDALEPPKGIKRWPHGFLFEWLPATQSLSTLQIEKNLLKVCKRWPNTTKNDSPRGNSSWLWPEPFLKPLLDTLQLAGQRYRLEHLQHAFTILKNDKREKAQVYCAQRLEALEKTLVQEAETASGALERPSAP